MSINVEPAWVTAAATVVLVIVTTAYVILSWRIVQQPRKQAEERERIQLRTAIYEPLFRNLEDSVHILKEDPLYGIDVKLEELGKVNPYFFSLVPHDLVERLGKFNSECKIYGRSAQFAREKLKRYLLGRVKELSKEQIVSFEGEGKIYMGIGSNRRHIFTFIFEGEHPEKWVEREKKDFVISPPIETIIYVNVQITDVTRSKNIASSPEVFYHFYELVQEEVCKDGELVNYINKWKALIGEANLLKEEIRKFLQ
jgi:hypothetical protein